MIEIINNFSSQGVSEIFKCPTHKQRYNSLFLEKSYNQSSPLCCAKCQTIKRLDPSKQLSIEDILESDKETIFLNWPLFGEANNIFQSLVDIPPVDFEEVSIFFKGLRSQFLEQIDRIEEKLKCQYKKIEDNRKQLISYYNSVSYKDILQSSIKQFQINPEKSLKDLNETIQQVADGRAKIYSDSQHIYKSLCYYKDYLSINSLEIFQDSIKNNLSEMEKIISYQIYDLFESKDTYVVALSQKQSFQNPVYYGQKSFVYNLYSRTNLQIIKILNQPNTYCQNKQKTLICGCEKCNNTIAYHQQQNIKSYENLKNLKIIN